MGKHYFESVSKAVRMVTQWMFTYTDKIVKQIRLLDMCSRTEDKTPLENLQSFICQIA